MSFYEKYQEHEPLTVAPVLLQGRKQIAVCFHVRPQVVTAWAREGAPIFIAGQTWQAEFNQLCRWLSTVHHAGA